MKPEETISLGSKILKEQLQIFLTFDDSIEPDVEQEEAKAPQLNENLFRSVDDLELSVRSANCLKNAIFVHWRTRCQDRSGDAENQEFWS